MRLKPIVDEIKASCPVFGGRVSGAAIFAPLPLESQPVLPAAIVVGEPDEALGRSTVSSEFRQDYRESVTVIGIFANPDAVGFAAWDQAQTARAELWRCLLGWQYGTELELLEYDGGMDVIAIDRARLYVGFGFAAAGVLGDSDSRSGLDIAASPDLSTVHVDVDVIDPVFDPNLAPVQGPDGRIEFQMREEDLEL